MTIRRGRTLRYEGTQVWSGKIRKLRTAQAALSYVRNEVRRRQLPGSGYEVLRGQRIAYRRGSFIS